MADEESAAGGQGLLGSRAMVFRLIALAVTLLLVLVVGYVVVIMSGPPTVDDLRERAGLNGKRELLVGVKDDQPGVALHEPKGTWTGFDIDIAYLIAEELDFRRSEVRFLAIESEDRARMQAVDTNGRRVGVDMVIASYSITPAREAMAGVTFSAPYLFTEQSVVTRADHAPVNTLEDLRDRKVCSLATATSAGPLTNARAVVVNRKRISECFVALDAGEVEAVSTDAAILAGFVDREPRKYTHHDIGFDATEAWGVNVGENDALRDLVNLALFRSREDPADARWEEAFDANLRSDDPVRATAPIADERQPQVTEVEIRQWPWERAG